MSNIWAIFQRELRSYFVSPLAYGVIAGFLIITGFMFYISLVQFQDLVGRAIMEAQEYRSGYRSAFWEYCVYVAFIAGYDNNAAFC